MAASPNKYTDIIVEIIGQIGIIKFNRPKTLNAFGGNLISDTIAAFRELNEHPTTIVTVLTGEGRFFSSGADVRGIAGHAEPEYANIGEKKIATLARFSPGMELLRSMIDHKKVFVLAMNGPAVGGGAAWFQGVADIVLASSTCYLQAPFSALGLVPEYGSAISFAQSIGVHRANDFFIFGRKLTATELESWGLVNRIFPHENFHQSVLSFLTEQLEINDGKSMMEAKRLQNIPLREPRMAAVINAVDALADRFVEGAPKARFAEKMRQLEEKSKSKPKGSKL